MDYPGLGDISIKRVLVHACVAYFPCLRIRVPCTYTLHIHAYRLGRESRELFSAVRARSINLHHALFRSIS